MRSFNSSAMRSLTAQIRLGLPADRKAAPVEKYIPGQMVDDLKARFAKINAFIMARGGWVVSIPGDATVVFEALPESSLAAELEAAGYDVMPADPCEGQRILPNAIVEQFTSRADGELEPLTEGSTRPVAETRRHAGIVRVSRFTLSI